MVSSILVILVRELFLFFFFFCRLFCIWKCVVFVIGYLYDNMFNVYGIKKEKYYYEWNCYC